MGGRSTLAAPTAVGNGPNSTAKGWAGGVAVTARGAAGVGTVALDLSDLTALGGVVAVGADIAGAGALITGSAEAGDVDVSGTGRTGGGDGSVGAAGAAVASRTGATSAGASSFLRRISRGCRLAPNHPAFHASTDIKAARAISRMTPPMTLRYFRRRLGSVATGASMVSTT